MTLDLYAENGQWKLSKTTLTKGMLIPKAAGGTQYDVLEFNFFLERKNMYHLLNIVAPLIIVSIKYSLYIDIDSCFLPNFILSGIL